MSMSSSSSFFSPLQDTANDAAIARAIAEQEQNQAAASASSSTQQQQQPPASLSRNSLLPPSSLSSLFRSQPPYQVPPHMCMVPCVIGGICVELMVDSGACSSVISLELVKRLKLEHRMDRRYGGVANGVGQANIVGKLCGIIVQLGNVEFLMDFMVLDLAVAPQGQSQQLLLLGLDQMRKYKCIIDLEQEVLVFGGQGGVQVPMLKADQQHAPPMAFRQEACNIM